MSKRVSNKRGKPRKAARNRNGHCKEAKWSKRKPFAFDPIQAIDQLIGKA